MLTDFIVAVEGDAPRIAKAVGGFPASGRLDAKGIDTVKLGRLEHILMGGEFNSTFDMDGRLLHETSKDGPWVVIFPDEFVARLGQLDDAGLSSTAAKWAAIEEFSPRHDNWSPRVVEQALRDLAALARRAVVEKKSILMRICL